MDSYENEYGSDKQCENENAGFINWESITESQLNEYKTTINQLISEFCPHNSAFICNNVNCDSSSHFKFLDSLFNFIISIILIASFNLKNINPSNNRNKNKCIPGWNKYVKVYYDKARLCFLDWKYKGRIKNSLEHAAMIDARKNFKSALNYCRKNENKVTNEILANKLKTKNFKAFWSNVRKNKKTFSNTATKIENETNPFKICDLFSGHFKKIFSKDKIFNNSDQFNSTYSFDDFFSSEDILNSIFELKNYTGFDNISNNHLKFAPTSLICLISRCINCCLSHSYLPYFITKGIMSPIIKDKLNNNDKLNNFRPIIHSSIFLKLVETLLLKRLFKYYTPNERQHSFRRGASVLSACLMLKETILTYFKSKSNVYACFLDFSKAFDHVNYEILFEKLIKIDVPCIYIKFIYNWYINQEIQVKYKNTLSQPWKMTNGVRQGGILSPFLFQIYIDGLIDKVVSSGIGCRMGYYMSNIIAYADDIVILAPSVTALQYLIDLCYQEACGLKLNFNRNKSICIRFSFNSISTDLKKRFSLGKELLENVNEIRYLGFMITYNLCNKIDIIRERNRFYGNFNCILRKFYYVDLQIFLTLFNSFCLCFYGTELWFENFNCKTIKKQFAIGYHKAVKKILQVPWREGN